MSKITKGLKAFRASHKESGKEKHLVERTKQVSVEGAEFYTPSDKAHSTVGINQGFRMTENYQSVMMEVNVTVPCDVGKELEALDYASEQADTYLEENADTAREALRNL